MGKNQSDAEGRISRANTSYDEEVAGERGRRPMREWRFSIWMNNGNVLAIRAVEMNSGGSRAASPITADTAPPLLRAYCFVNLSINLGCFIHLLLWNSAVFYRIVSNLTVLFKFSFKKLFTPFFVFHHLYFSLSFVPQKKFWNIFCNFLNESKKILSNFAQQLNKLHFGIIFRTTSRL